MMNLPKAIKCFNLMRETSYANATLQVFIQLECIQNWYKQLLSTGNISHHFYNTTLTKGIYLLFDSLSKGMNLDSSKIILDFSAKTNDIWHKEISYDPYHFLYYLLEILHLENNLPNNPNFNTLLYGQLLRNNIKNDQQVFQLFNDYFQQTQNSFISYNFFNIQKYLVTCPICSFNYSYGIKKIIKFNVDEILRVRNNSFPLKFGTNLSLSDCFEISFLAKNTNCQLCFNNLANEMQNIYDYSNVLIIAFNRNQHSVEYKGDIQFFSDLNMSSYMINQNSDNKFFKLKGVVSRYRRDKYFADVLINGQYYRLMDNLNNMEPDVKILNNFYKLMEYEPQLLIYEIDYQSKAFYQMKKIETENIKSLMLMMNLNMQLNYFNNLANFAMNNNNNNDNNNNEQPTTGFVLKFLCIPQIWDNDMNKANLISPQVISGDTIKDTIDKFYSKLAKPREAILHFSFNGQILDVNSQQTLRDLNIDVNSEIYAIKSPNFDELNLPPNNIINTNV